MASPKVTFDGGGAFLRDTRRDVEAYLAPRRRRAWGRARLYAKAPVAIGLTVGAWLVLVLGHPGVVPALVSLGALVLGALLTAFCVQHDANHGAYFRSKGLNHLVGWSADTLLGFSSYAWRVKHNIAHHTYTNVDRHDDDITQMPFARLAPTQQPRRWYRYQHLYIWPLYMLMGLRWQTIGDIAAFARRTIGETVLRLPRGLDLAGLVVGKIAFVTWALVIPALVYPWWAVLAAYVAFAMITSLVMATTFQLAHCVEEASFASADELRVDRVEWAVHEVQSTVNFCHRNRLLTWMLGGLNYQIEHHLFPALPHTHYPQLAPIVRRNCERHGIRYATQPTLRRALRSHSRHLRSMGALGIPAEIEMG
jgi:linoleoyl-CoA desaturase